MSEVITIDKTGMTGSDTFPLTANDVYKAVETIAAQNIRGLKSANRLDDALYNYDVVNGKVIEEAVIEMAKAGAFDKTKADFSPSDPVVHPLYFNNYEEKQFKTTVRRNDIRKILADKGVGVEDVVAQVLDTLNQGEGHYDFMQSRALIFGAPSKDFALISGRQPKTMRGVLFAAREMYNHLRADNNDCTAYDYVCATPEEDIRIAISVELLNLIDVGELAHVFNIEKEEMFGRIVPVPTSDMAGAEARYKMVVYDRKAMGKARRLYEYSQDIIGSGLYQNHYLTVEKAFFYNGLFKACFMDCTDAAEAALAEVAEQVFSVSNVLENVETSNAAYKAVSGSAYDATLTAASGYKKLTASDVTVKMSGQTVTNAFTAETGKVAIANVTGPVVITATGVANG